ncbi:MAG: hypothetical protein DWH78_09815 [Planctomycetota bacterium]|nr:MAG: hypothetical protein DWH78_09815 [Planctomycetota bacterium]
MNCQHFETCCRLWNDESGFVSATEILIMTTILGLGMVVGLQTVRDAMIQELGDVAVALDHLDQSYSFTVGTVSSQYIDTITLQDPAGAPPACIGVCLAATGE